MGILTEDTSGWFWAIAVKVMFSIDTGAEMIGAGDGTVGICSRGRSASLVSGARSIMGGWEGRLTGQPRRGPQT